MELSGAVSEGQHALSDTDVSVSDTEVYTSNDEGGTGLHKKKKKKKHRREKNRNSDTSDDEGGSKKRHKKKKKHRKKKKKDTAAAAGSVSVGSEVVADDGNPKGGRRVRGGDSSTDLDSDGPQIAKRAPKKATRGGLKTDPADWSKEDLMDKVKKFAVFKIDKKTGAASLLIEEKKILDESLKVLKELFERNTEIQTITVMGCFLVDDTFTVLMEKGVMKQRHVKSLNFSGNALTKKSMSRVVEYFRDRDERPLESIDVRNNILRAPDIRQMYEALPRLKHFNGINLVESKHKKDLDLSGKKMKVSEVSIVCCLARESQTIKRLDLSKNYVDSDSLHVLADLLQHSEDIEAVNLALNPLTNNGSDHTGSLALCKAMQNSTVVKQLDLLGGKLRPDVEESILRSVMINRSVGESNPLRFKQFLDQRLLQAAPERPQYHLDGWMPSLKVDPAFLYSRQNAARNREVEVRGDKIFLPRR